MKIAVTLATILSILALGASVFYQPVQNPSVGAAAGPDVSFRTFFHDNAIIGGTDYATSSAGASTYTATAFANAKVIEQNATGALTVTLPTGALLSAAGFLPYAGDTDTKYIHASTTVITMAGAAGITLSSASTSLKVYPNTTGTLTCARLGATEGRLIQCLLTAD